MIDEGWQEDYGIFEFNRRKIPEPRLLIDRLHAMGFAVMLRVTPLVSCAGPRFKELRDQGFLLRDRTGAPAIREWWNGYSAVIDLTNPQALQWMHDQLHGLMAAYGVDGYKFDAGDRYFYRDNDSAFQPTAAREQTALYNRLGEAYPLNEFRAAWNFGGRGIVSRLQDKKHSWEDYGIITLIPHTILQGVLGYVFCCPDMVGGGDIGSFTAGQALDEELFVRCAQANACMGMMQLSISPWRVLSEENAALVSRTIALRMELTDRICALAEQASQTGEPFVRPMAYVFPGEGMEEIRDQFMLGDDVLACPALEKGARERRAVLPRGLWKTWRGDLIEGGRTVSFPVDRSTIPILYREHR